VLPLEGSVSLQKDAERQVGRAAAAEQARRLVEVDVRLLGEVPGVAGRVAGALELLDPPGPDELRFGVEFEFEVYRRQFLFLPLLSLPHSVVANGGLSPLRVKRSRNARLIRVSYGREEALSSRRLEDMKSLFSLHPAAIAGEHLAGRISAGPAKQDAEPERDMVRPEGRRRRLAALLAFRRRREAATAGSANV
jgi:hypothetical protein